MEHELTRRFFAKVFSNEISKMTFHPFSKPWLSKSLALTPFLF